MSKVCWSFVKIKNFNCRHENNGVTTLTSWGHMTIGLDISKNVSPNRLVNIVNMPALNDRTSVSGALAQISCILCPMLLHCIGQTIMK